MSEAEGKKIKRLPIRMIAGIKILFNGEGFFINPSPWTDEGSEVLAHEAGVEEVCDTLRMAVHSIRKFYEEQGKAPLNHHLKVGSNMSMAEPEVLFPGGIKMDYAGSRACLIPRAAGRL
jgi:sulfur relay (sulfurtransferase) DsrC/TusE family protein